MNDVYKVLLTFVLINQVLLFYLSGQITLWKYHANILMGMRLNGIIFFLLLLLYVFEGCGNCLSCIKPSIFCN